MDQAEIGGGTERSPSVGLIPNASSTAEENAQALRSQNAERSKRKRTMSIKAEHQSPHDTDSERPSTSTAPTTSGPNSSRRSSSRRNSTAYTTPRPSNACSRRSSFLIRQPSETRPWGPPVPQRRSSTAHARTYSTNAIASHRKSLLLFRSLETSLASEIEPFPSRPHAHLTSTSMPTLFSPTAVNKSSSTQSSSTLVESPKLQHQHSYSNHVPATTIDWTLPSTRRRQYEEIEQSSRGIRGLVRRLTPSLFRRHGGRGGFYDADKDSDVGSVRRYKLEANYDDSDEGETEDEKGSYFMDVVKMGKGRCCAGRGIGRRWSCFVLGRKLSKKASRCRLSVPSVS